MGNGAYERPSGPTAASGKFADALIVSGQLRTAIDAMQEAHPPVSLGESGDQTRPAITDELVESTVGTEALNG